MAEPVEITICVTARVTVDPIAWAAEQGVPLNDVPDDLRDYIRNDVGSANELINLAWHREGGDRLRDAQQPVTAALRDGRVVDAFPSGNVQIYTPDLRHGYEITLPPGWVDGGTVPIHNLG